MGIIALAALVLARMGTLLDQVQVQAVQLAALARVDALTGAPNRRTWDHELSRACAQALDRGEPLALAILDLDHFKYFNDAHGHQEGDRLLREAVAAWTAVLHDGQMLARYGGEEFAVLLPDLDLASGRRGHRRDAAADPGRPDVLRRRRGVGARAPSRRPRSRRRTRRCTAPSAPDATASRWPTGPRRTSRASVHARHADRRPAHPGRRRRARRRSRGADPLRRAG